MVQKSNTLSHRFYLRRFTYIETWFKYASQNPLRRQQRLKSSSKEPAHHWSLSYTWKRNTHFTKGLCKGEQKLQSSVKDFTWFKSVDFFIINTGQLTWQKNNFEPIYLLNTNGSITWNLHTKFFLSIINWTIERWNNFLDQTISFSIFQEWDEFHVPLKS